MIRRIASVGITLCLMIGVALTGSASAAPKGSPIVIGLSIAETGSEAIPTLVVGYREAVKEVNAVGGLRVGRVRHPVQLVVLDNRSSDSLLAEQVHTLVLSDHAVALVSGCCDLNVAEAPIANALKIPLVGTAIPNELVEQFNGQWAWNIFVNLFNPRLFSTVIPSLGTTDRKVAIVVSSDPEGQGASAVTKAEASQGGYDVVVNSAVPLGTTDFSSFIQEAKSSQAQVLVVQMPGPDCFNLWKQMKALGYVPKVALANQCGALPTWTQLGALGNGALLGMNWTPTSGLPEAKKLAAVFNRVYRGDVIDQESAVTAYTTMEVLLDAITRAHSTSPAAINAAIKKTNGAYPLGHIEFNSQHVWSGNTFLAQWQNKKVVQVYPPVPGTKVEFPPSGLGG